MNNYRIYINDKVVAVKATFQEALMVIDNIVASNEGFYTKMTQYDSITCEAPTLLVFHGDRNRYATDRQALLNRFAYAERQASSHKLVASLSRKLTKTYATADRKEGPNARNI